MTEAPTKGKILLIDDDKFLADMYSMKFTQGGYTMEACLSVNDALQVLKNGFVPDVILFDLTMPDRDGFSFLQSLNDEKIAPKAIRIALTNQSNDEERQKAAAMGTTRYIVKASMIPSEVVGAVAEELAKKTA